jgi:dihydrodipicolinate synthase/N-acetylneuraminate lyase
VTTVEPFDLLRPEREILGMSAVLLPFTPSGDVDWTGFESLLGRTVEAGLVPAVNMDTGYVNLLDETTQDRVLAVTASAVAGQRVDGHPDPFVAGAFVGDTVGDTFAADRYRARIDAIRAHGATPVVFPSHGLSRLAGPDLVAAHDDLARHADRLIAFELGTQFVPFGRIHDLETYEALLGIEGVIGAKHSSLDRQMEWDRLRLRDRVRPDFRVFTGNDLAIDMVMYGSDYLLGLSAFAPDAFARRDRMWATGDPGFHQLNDVLQYLGAFAFRAPVPAYKHDAARFLALRGWIGHHGTHADAPTRPDADDEVLAALLDRLDEELDR